MDDEIEAPLDDLDHMQAEVAEDDEPLLARSSSGGSVTASGVGTASTGI